MKSKALAFCLSTIVTIGVFTACKKTTDVAPTPEPAKPELSSKDPQALSASLKVYHGERLTGNVPAPSGTSLQLEAGENYIHAFKGGLAVINPQLTSNSAIAGYYLKIQGATEYFKIDYSKPRGARISMRNKSKHGHPFGRGLRADSLSDGNVDSALVIVLPPNLKVPDTICVSYWAYDWENNVSNTVTTCVVINNIGPDAEGAWLNGSWRRTADSYPDDTLYTIIYNRWQAFQWDYYCEYDSISGRYRLSTHNNGSTPLASDSVYIKKDISVFNNNGTMLNDYSQDEKYVDYYYNFGGTSTYRACDSIFFQPVYDFKYKDSFTWSYNSVTKKLIVVGDVSQTENDIWYALEYYITKVNDSEMILQKGARKWYFHREQ